MHGVFSSCVGWKTYTSIFKFLQGRVLRRTDRCYRKKNLKYSIPVHLQDQLELDLQSVPARNYFLKIYDRNTVSNFQKLPY
jgi:hypothetical protein